VLSAGAMSAKEKRPPGLPEIVEAWPSPRRSPFGEGLPARW